MFVYVACWLFVFGLFLTCLPASLSDDGIAFMFLFSHQLHSSAPSFPGLNGHVTHAGQSEYCYPKPQ